MRPLHALASLSLLIFAACGGPKTTSLTPKPSEEVIEEAPEWFLKPPADNKHLYGLGTATSRDMQISLQKAKTTAQTDLAQQISTRLGNLTKQFQEETGLQEDSELLTQFTSATKAVTNETLIGARLEKQKLLPEGEIYRAYVLMALPLGKANQALMEKIRADQNLYTRFRSTQAFEELDKELKALEEK
jgi:hypothetical protein